MSLLDGEVSGHPGTGRDQEPRSASGTHGAPHRERPVCPPYTPNVTELALVLPGGGARTAYQVGVLRALARRFPRLDPPILTGVSAGAINCAWLASHTGTFAEKVEALAGMWKRLTTDEVFRVDSFS